MGGVYGVLLGNGGLEECSVGNGGWEECMVSYLEMVDWRSVV